MGIFDFGVGALWRQKYPAWGLCALAFIGLTSCIGGPGDECGSYKPSAETPADLPSLAGCWSLGGIDTAEDYFSYQLYCFSTDSSLLRASVSRARHRGEAWELWGEFRMHSESPNRFSLELESAYSQLTSGNIVARVDTTYPTGKKELYHVRGDSMIVAELEWCGFQNAKYLERAEAGSLELLAAYTLGPFGSSLRRYGEKQKE